MVHPIDITPLTFLDYPKKAACILWYTGCNLRCPYCYNPELVLGRGGGLDEMAFLRERAGFLDAVVLSGGECTLNPDIMELCRAIKRETGLLIKIDTNGSNPQVVRALAEEQLIDYVALDNKMPGNRSWHLPGGALLFDRFRATLKVLQHYALPHEVRTTVHPGLLDEADILRMVRETMSFGYTGNYYLQFFFDAGKGKTLGNLPPPSRRYDRSLLNDMTPLPIVYRNFPEDRYKY